MTRRARGDVRGVLAVALAVALAAGCAAIPETSDVQVVGRAPATAEPPAPDDPAEGVDPLLLVRGFIRAGDSLEDAHAAAREFLTESAGRSWDDAAGLTVIEDGFDTVFAPSPGAAADREARTVQVRGRQLGRVERDASFTPDGQILEVRMRVVRERSEWRISDPPQGLLITVSDFQQSYEQARVSFVDPNRGTLVPDLRWVPSRPASTLPGRVLELLLAGPSGTLADAVTTALPPGVRTRTNVIERADGTPTVDFTDLGALGPQERRLVAAQVVGSLNGFVTGPIRLLADGQPLVAGEPEWSLGEIISYLSGSVPAPDLPGLVSYGGLVRRMDGTPVDGPMGSGALSVLSAASSPEGEQLAAVVARPDGGPRLVVGPTGKQPAPVQLDAVSMTRPTWRPSGNEVWTVLNGTTVAGIGLANGGTPTAYPVDAPELSRLGPITDLRLSRDGVRVAAVAGGRLVVATVVGGPGEVSIRDPRVLLEGNLPPVASVDWAASETLAVAAAEPATVATVTVDGVLWRQLSSINLTPPLRALAAAPGRPTVVADETGLWSYSETEQVWESLLGGVGPAAVPFYPG